MHVQRAELQSRPRTVLARWQTLGFAVMEHMPARQRWPNVNHIRRLHLTGFDYKFQLARLTYSMSFAYIIEIETQLFARVITCAFPQPNKGDQSPDKLNLKNFFTIVQ